MKLMFPGTPVEELEDFTYKPKPVINVTTLTLSDAFLKNSLSVSLLTLLTLSVSLYIHYLTLFVSL